jgi:hypothetical protein
MSVEKKLVESAETIARQLQSRAGERREQLNDLKSRLTEIEEELQAAETALDRLANFKVKLGALYRCPQCWILDGVNSALQPSSAPDRDTTFKCSACAFQLSIPSQE